MKQGRALPEVLMELQRQNAAKQDYIAPAQSFHLSEDGQTFGITHQNTTFNIFNIGGLTPLRKCYDSYISTMNRVDTFLVCTYNPYNSIYFGRA